MTKTPKCTKSRLLLFFLLILLSTSLDSVAQNVTLLTQADVDAFDPSTTIINGNLNIGSYAPNANISQLSNLSNLTTITGNLTLRGNDNLFNIDGLNSLTSVGDTLALVLNINLLNIDGFSNLTSSGNDPSSHLILANNHKLKNLDGFSNLTSIVGDLSVKFNNELESIEGLNGITTCDGHILIVDNKVLTNVNGLRNLTSVLDLRIRNHANLTNVDGLSSLTTVSEHLYIYSNNSLLNLDGLSGLTSVGNDLFLQSNAQLANLDGLSNLTYIGEDLTITGHNSLSDCCGIQDLIANKTSSIGGIISIFQNQSECDSEDQILDANCRMKLTVSLTPSCIGANNGAIQAYLSDYDTTPFSYQWERQEDNVTGSGVSDTDDFIIEMLESGTYSLTVTNADPDTVVKTDIILSQKDGFIFEVIEVNTTNSSNGQSNGNITLTVAGGVAPYTYIWSGPASGSETGLTDNMHTIPFLGFGEYVITVEDNVGASKVVNISLLDDEVQVIFCESPMDIVILNDVSGSVDAIEYAESKQFFVDFLQEVNLGNNADESRAAIVEWSSVNEQKLKIPITSDIAILETYLDNSRSYEEGTAPHEAMIFGKTYLDANARPDVEKVLILSTDGTGGQISSSLVALADEFKAEGYHIITIAFDEAFSSSYTRGILSKVASVESLAPGAPAYSLLSDDLAQTIVFNYLCPIDPGSSATAYFNRDGAIDIIEVEPIGDCPFPDFAEITVDISAYRELSIPAGTPITFYHNDPNQAGATAILTWLIPCAIATDSTETYSITIPMDGPSNIFAVLNDDGVQGAPINFPITTIEEIAYSNNIDSERICLDTLATIQAIKYSSLPYPSCDTIVNYTINVCNISEIDAFGVEVSDNPPVGFVLIGLITNSNGCAIDNGGSYDIPADCCFSIFLTYDAGSAPYGFYNDQDVFLNGPINQTYYNFDGSTTTDEDVTIDGTIDCPSTTIEFTKSVNIDESCDDGFVEFTFTINNELNIPLQGLAFRDVLPAPCTWAYLPYGENGLSIANPNFIGNEAVFIIDKVEANTVATFHMDARLNYWTNNGTLSNTATLENVIDLTNGGNTTLTSNTTNTQITASPIISLPDTLIVNIANDTVTLGAILSTVSDLSWTSEGDGHFIEESSENALYIVGTQDSIDGEVMLFLSAISDCNETEESVLIQLVDCNLEIEILVIGECDNMGTPVDGSDDTYDVTFIVSGDYISQDSLFILTFDAYSDTLTYFTEHTITLAADGIETLLSFVDLEHRFCFSDIIVNQEICSEECSISIDDLTISDCDDNGTPQDSTDDTYEIEFTIISTNPGMDSMFTTLFDGQLGGPFSYGESVSMTLSADSVLDSILVVDSNIDTCAVWIVVNQGNCFLPEPCSLTLADLTISDCIDNGTPQDSTDDTYIIEFTITTANPGLDSTFSTLYDGQPAGPFIYGENISIILSADSSLDSILVVDSNIDSCAIWVVVNQGNCFVPEPCSLTLADLIISDCIDNGTPQDSTDDTYKINFTISSINPSTDSLFTIHYNGQMDGPFVYGEIVSGILPADSVLDSILVVDSNIDSCSIWIVVNQDNCYSPAPCEISLYDLSISDCDDNETPQDSTDDTYIVEFNLSSDSTYTLMYDENIYGPFQSNSQENITLSANGLSDTLLFTILGSDSCFIEEIVNQNSCSSELPPIDSAAVFVPNVFTPNADKTNDEWSPTLVGENIKVLDCSIFDRWGNRVYFSTGILPLWDGRYHQNFVAEGVYVYVLTYSGDEVEVQQKVGNITVIR